MTIEQEARNEATRRAWDGELSHTDRDGFRARIDASEAFERGYIAGASRPVTDEMVEAATFDWLCTRGIYTSLDQVPKQIVASERDRMRAALEAAMAVNRG